MIVFQEGLVLVSDNDYDENSPLIGYKNKTTVSNIYTVSAVAGFPATNLARPATHLLWKGSTTSGLDAIHVASLSGDSDYFGIARHNFGSAGITLGLIGSFDGGSTWTSLGALNPTTDDPIMFYFEKGAYTDLYLSLGVGTTAAIASVVYCGEVLRVQRRLYVGHTPITLGRQVTAMIGRSQSGNFLGRIVIGEGRSNSVNLQHLTPDWYRNNFDPFIVAAKTIPFFFAWRPQSYPLEVGYCTVSNDVQPNNQMANGMMQVTMELSGVA